MPTATIFTCSSLELSADEKAFFKDVDPFGFILFADNIESPDQVRRLTESMRLCVEREDAPVLIDQEGGRVARLRPPQWRETLPAKSYGDLALKDKSAALRAIWINGRLLASELYELGINVNCAPVLDLSIPGAHDVIGDRSFGSDPTLVVDLARAFSEGLMSGGVLAMIKHVPGHGRAMADSHKELPTVDLPKEELKRTDFAPFKGLSDVPLAMTAHILFPQIDPDRPATTSPIVINEIVRGYIGYRGLIVSDDVTMAALSGSDRERAERTRAAGCDIVLHCYAELAQMKEIAKGSCEMEEHSVARWATAQEKVKNTPVAADLNALQREHSELMKSAKS
tara:strand:- start:157 stop:1176 length:1020 start_codon:yes stop_codon:yes gene_type:complete